MVHRRCVGSERSPLPRKNGRYERERDYERDRDRGSSFPNPFGRDYDDDDRRRYSQGSHKKRKKSFFDELFD